LALVLQISKGNKTHTISTKGHAVILKQAKATSDSVLMEFIKVGKSKVLKQEREQQKEKKITKDVIKAINGRNGN
jgi:hypothetical protein